MGKLEGMESSLWPQLVQGFKDLSNRLKVLELVLINLEFEISFVEQCYEQVGAFSDLARRPE